MNKERLFTFGCSMTNYCWPTWADILGYDVDHHNWGFSGLGNVGIFLQLMEAGYKNRITKGDTVVVMWTFLGREDRYVKDKWLAGSGVHTNKVYDNNWIERYFCEKGSLIKELGCIAAAIHVLNDWGCDWKFLTTDEIVGAAAYSKGTHLDIEQSRKDLDNFVNAVEVGDFNILKNQPFDTAVMNTYIDVFKSLTRPCLYDFLLTRYGTDIPTKLKYKDPHPTPDIFLEYVKEVFPKKHISKECQDWVDGWTEKVINSNSPEDLNWHKWPQRF
jgi:hypothetical protein